jgi:proteasome accessory factor B
MMFSRRSWYVIGRSSLHRDVRTFHLGRILESTPTDDSFKPPPRFSAAKHLGLAWHMIREPDKKARVVVHFQSLVAANVAEVTWHPTEQIVHRDDGSIEFSATVEGLREISWWILGYGDQAEVLEPRELRDMIADRVRGMAATYGLTGLKTSPEAARTRKRTR